MSRPPHLLLIAGALCALSACRNDDASGAGGAPDGRPLALVGGVIHTEPGAPPIIDGALLIEGGRIADVGPRARVRVPEGARVIDVSGRTVLAGFRNSHVHLLEPEWAGVDTLPAERVAAHLRETFTRFGFAHVFDVAAATARAHQRPDAATARARRTPTAPHPTRPNAVRP